MEEKKKTNSIFWLCRLFSIACAWARAWDQTSPSGRILCSGWDTELLLGGSLGRAALGAGDLLGRRMRLLWSCRPGWTCYRAAFSWSSAVIFL